MALHKNKKFNQLPEITVSWEKLLLDPNNPRLHSSTEPEIDLDGPEGMEFTLNEQPALQKKMNTYDISDLTVPMEGKGFISRGIPAVLVKKPSDWPKEYYLTLEGNRRLTAVRVLMADESKKLSEEVLKSFKNIKVIDCTSLTNEEIEEYLGMIHIGGTKGWDLMPKSKYLFSQFIRELCKENGLSITDNRFENNFINKSFLPLLDTTGLKALKTVASLSSIKQGDVKKHIAIFRMSIQVNNYLDQIEAEKTDASIASFFEETYSAPNLRMYFEIDEKNLVFSQSGLERWVDMCCETPDNLGHPDEEKRGPVIIQATAGDSNLRDFKSILKNDPTNNRDYVLRVQQEREKAKKVWADLQSILYKDSLVNILGTISKQFDKINLGQMEEEWSEKAESLYEKIKVKFKQMEGSKRNG